MKEDLDCFGKEIVINGIHGYYCKHHPRCLFIEDCYKKFKDIIWEEFKKEQGLE